MRRGLAAVLLLVAALRPVLAAGEPEALQRLFEAPALEVAWFTPELLAAAPLADIARLRDQLIAKHGRFLDATPLGEEWQVRLERALVPANILLDAGGRIAGLWFGAALALDRTVEQVAGDLGALPGEVSLVLYRDGETLAERAPERLLAVGSSFKLAVLAALAKAIESTRLSWDEVLRLRDRHRSLPTGILQDWPAGAPFTVHSLAAMMIAQSDNTATDALIDFLGIERIEPLLPPETRPLMTTRQYFILGGAAQAERRAAYLGGTVDERRGILVGLNRFRPSLADFLAGAAGPEFGWHLSAAQLCQLMDGLLGMDVLAINPGVVSPRGWREVGFKGGSTLGAVNMTTGLESFTGRRWCLSVTWNDPDGVDLLRFATLYGEMLALLSKD
jgi:hypothetical protein